MTDISLTQTAVPRAPSHSVSLREAFLVWLRVAALSFGGPAGQIAMMHRIIVDEKKWVGEAGVLHALRSLMPLPGAISIMALSYVYAAFGNLPTVAALFFGLKAAVLAIVLNAVHRVGSRAL